MNSIFLVIISLVFFFIGYNYYSAYISKHLFNLDDNIQTPAHEFEDKVDFVPTKKHILFGHHYTSIAGAAPIIGPCIAAYWGWLPALAWVVLGTVFIGAVHDFGALVVSLREKGKSVGDIAGKLINKRVRIMFLFFVLLLTWLVLAVFAMAISGLFVSVPSAVIPVNIEIIIAMIIGYIIYQKKIDALIPSIIALFILYIFIYVGTYNPISLPFTDQNNAWIVILFIYSFISSLIPVWLLLQPRDFINSHQLIVGLVLLFLGIFIAAPMVDAPAIRLSNEDGAPPIFPMLFVTIACGAISGFHGLVSSGTTSKQVNKLKDARMIGYGGMIGEGILALASTIAAVAGIALVNECHIPSIGSVENLNWAVYYDSWASATKNKATAFVLGGGALIEQLGINHNIAKTLMAVLVISFAATTLDTATRIQRFIISEIGDATKIEILKNRFLATFIAVIPAIILSLWSINDPVTGELKKIGWLLWPIFGASNQMLAALILLVLTIYFYKKGKNVLILFIPMIFVISIAMISLFFKTQDFYYQNNIFLLTINSLLLVLIIWMLVEGLLVFKKIKKSINKKRI